MRTATVDVYSYPELTEEAKDRAFNHWLETADYPWQEEARQTIAALGGVFGVVCYDWEYGVCRPYNFRLKFDNIDGDAMGLSGNRARSWLSNNIWDNTFAEKYAKKDRQGRTIWHTLGEVWDCCPLTGIWLDNEALRPLRDFVTGKGDYDTRRLYLHDRTTVEDVIRACFDALFAELTRDCEYCSSREYFEEEANANDYEFTASGDRW